MATLGQYNAAEMTAQEVFDAGAAHLLEQGKRSISIDKDGIGRCVYSGQEGRACGAAPFIQNYVPSMEGVGWNILVRGFEQTPRHRSLIVSLQACHDSTSPCDWKLELARLAGDKGLNPAILDNYEAITDDD